MRLRQKTRTGRDREPGTNVLNKTQDILLETCHIPLTQEVALYSRTGGFTPEQCKLKTVFRNDTTIHFVFKRNALVFLGYSYCELGQMKVAPLVKTQKFREKRLKLN